MMAMWQSILITIFSSLLGGGSIAWVFLKLYVKDIAGKVIDEKLATIENKFKENLKNYTTKEDMQLERKELLEEVERRFLSIVAFREFEKRIEEHFKTTDRRFADSSKRFDKIDVSLEHITDLIIKKNN